MVAVSCTFFNQIGPTQPYATAVAAGKSQRFYSPGVGIFNWYYLDVEGFILKKCHWRGMYALYRHIHAQAQAV
jgi:hypothetical protein